MVLEPSTSMSRIGQIGFTQTDVKVPPHLGVRLKKKEYKLAGLSKIALVKLTSEILRNEWKREAKQQNS